MRIAKNWLIAEIETERCLVTEPHSYEKIVSLTDDDLLGIAKYDGKASKPTKVITIKDDGNPRESYYIPWSDRLLMNAAIVENYSKILGFTCIRDALDAVNYDRPLTQYPDNCYLYSDYKDPYTKFKKRIVDDENTNQIIVHTDIKNFAGSVRISDLAMHLDNAGWTWRHIEQVISSLETWNEYGVNGIPQGYAFTDIFLKMMMAPIDKAMISTYPNISYYRYVDDIQLSGDDHSEIAEAFGFLKTQLADYGFIINQDKTVFAAPGQTNIRHSFNSEACVQNLCDNSTHVSEEDILRCAYQQFVYPGKERQEKPKYLVGHILREMSKLGMNDFAHDVLALIKKYPDRAKKILQKSAETKLEDKLPLNGLATYLFGDCSTDTNGLDGIRLDYLAVLKEHDFPISEYDRRIIANGLPEFIDRLGFAFAYRDEPKLYFTDKNLNL